MPRAEFGGCELFHRADNDLVSQDTSDSLIDFDTLW